MKKALVAIPLLLALLLTACSQGGSDTLAKKSSGGQDTPSIVVYKSPA